MLVCADQELCKLPNRPLGEKDGHECRLGCGGRLHGICGEPEEEGGQEIHRVCNPCIAKKQKTPGSSKQPKRASPESELAGDGAAAKKTKPAGKAAGKAGKSTRTRLNFGQQLEVLKLLDEKTTHAEIARRYSISTSAISLIKGKRQQLEQAAATNARSTTSKSSRRGDFPELEKDVLALIEEARRVPLPITRATIESFGIAVRDKLVAAPSTPADAKERLRMFGASEKWVRNLVNRHNLTSFVLHGEAGSLDAEAAAEGMAAIRRACSKYKVENIFNVDETGMYYRLLPKRTYLSTTEKRKTARGTKGMKAKDRVSAYMCTNATGTAKVPMAIIGRAKNPRCFRSSPSPLTYFPQANAWSDSATFKKWWLEVFIPFIRKWTHEPVLLLMDGCASHGDLVDPRGQIEVSTYPPNCTYKYQPMDMGVIETTKRYYRKGLLDIRVSTMSSVDTLRQQAKDRKMAAGTMGLAEGHPAHLLDAAELLEGAWDKVMPTTIARCLVKAETLPAEHQAQLANDAGKGVMNGAKDAGVAELTETLNALSIGVRDAASGPGVQDSELVEVLANLNIAPGAPAHPTAIKAVEAWAGLEEQPEFAETLSEDAKEIFMEKVNNTFKEDENISDDDDELDSAKDSESAGGGGKKAPPSFAELADFFGPLEQYAESCGIGDAGHFLRKAKMAFLAATFARPARQLDIRVFADS